ncbi:hypothetical protein [Candidatus Nitrotoga sp. BS]|uniref:hypothetical protein n=1 Tax=Candidatus Nitrotoga sp. BS TaxID=2890408 RepID=UPI001EF18856|nr:hypothetical protein [Candidatus Nitrotoga sp. BS]
MPRRGSRTRRVCPRGFWEHQIRDENDFARHVDYIHFNPAARVGTKSCPPYLATWLALVAEQSVGNRPGRIEPRAIKRRHKPYQLLTKTRDLAREQLIKYRYPKKLKGWPRNHAF